MLLRIILRNLAGNLVRTVFTAVAVAVCVLAFLLLRAISTGWLAGGSETAGDLYTRHRLSVLSRVPVRVVRKVRTLEFVAHASPFLVFPTEDTRRPGATVGGAAVDAEEFLAVRMKTSISTPSEQRDRWLAMKTGALVGKKLAEERGWKVGDQVALTSAVYPLPDGQPWKFTIEGIYTPTSAGDAGDFVYVHYDYVNAALRTESRDKTNGIVVACKPGTTVADGTAAIDRALEEDFPALTTDVATAVKGLQGMFSAFFALLDSLSTILVFVVALLLSATVSLTVRERTTNYAVMRAVGFGSGTVAFLVLAEAASLAVTGAFLGCAAAELLVNRVLAPLLRKSVLALPNVHISAPVMLATVAAAGAIGAAMALPSFISVIRVRLTDALRFVG